MQLSEQQLNLFKDRYALKDKNGEPVETSVEQMWSRVAKAIANDANEAGDFYEILKDFKFVPGGRILAGAGAETEKTFYNCYVIPVETKGRRNWRFSRVDGSPRFVTDAGSDSREAIFDTIQTMVDIMSRGGGVGINWSVLRPSNSYLTRISGTSSGPVGWMDVASTAVGEVIQGGSRRGAAMFMLNDWHPDVLNFINAKREKGKITNANISVAVSEEFMERLGNDDAWEFRFPDTTDEQYNLRWDGDLGEWEAGGGRVKSYGKVPAREVWSAITSSAHASGEPGVVFLDRYNAQSTANGAERIICVNPCGEQGLGAYSVCNLGALNLDRYVVTAPDGDPIFHWGRLAADARTSIRFLDRVIDKSFYFIEETALQQARLRRIGLGVMGLADALVRLGIRYGSPEAVAFTERVFQTMKDNAIAQSMWLAEFDKPAGAWQNSMWNRPFLAEWKSRHEGAAIGPLRNLFLLTQAPTGTTSLLAGVNSGIEPFFNKNRVWREDRTGGREVLFASLAEFDGRFPSYVVDSSDVTVEEHIAMQAAVQKYVDSSVSKTINAPKDQSVEEVDKALRLSYRSGLKGIAYYRDGSRSEQVLYHEAPNEKIAKLEARIKELEDSLNFSPQIPFVGALPSVTFSAPIEWQPISFSGHPAGCPGEVIYEEGCKKCYTCSWSAC